MPENVRIDKYLWAVRVFKTRNLATEECKKGHVIINDIQVKPSRIVRKNEKIYIKFPPIIRSFVVLDVIDKRVSAVLAKDAIQEVTPEVELDKLKQVKNVFVRRDAGSGRPTKKDRRSIDKFRENEL
ncbi:MAG: RNA-binding S4 domain-containing protein [Bacteroidales bacterium]|jgi:ribosome-associated heat shock protein Hsp15|nr:RNA-binding S4 domain-containing protein [Bacteroidales bacterium]